MDAFTLPFTVLRLLLGAILLMAAAGKLLHRQAYAQTLAEFGIPIALQPQLAWLMPTCELAIGSMAPDFALPEMGTGEAKTLAQLRSVGLPVLLVFSDIACGPCAELAPRIESWHRQYQGLISIAVILRVDAGQLHRPHTAGSCTTLLQEDRKVSERYDALVTPSAVLVSAEGTIASHLALGSKDIYDLLESTVPQIDENRNIAA